MRSKPCERFFSRTCGAGSLEVDQAVPDYSAGANKLLEACQGARRGIQDFYLSHYARYLVLLDVLNKLRTPI
jgi:hypothetical protein